MADFTLGPARFPVGTVVSVFVREAFVGDAGPFDDAVTTATTDANLVTEFSGLAFDTVYWAAAELEGSWRKVAFRTEPQVLVAATTADIAAEALARADAITAAVSGLASQTALDAVGSDVATRAVAANLRYNALVYGSIQAAVDAAEASRGTVEIPRGTYTLATPVLIPDYVSVEGHGRGTVIRCSGNNYAFSFAPGNHSRLSSLYIDAVSTQTSGGGIDFESAGSNTQVDHIWFGSNLWISVRITPVGSGGLLEFDHLRWLVGGGRNVGIQIGDGTNNVPNVFIRNCMGLVANNADIALWMDIRNNVDTLNVSDVIFFKGTKGIRIADDTLTGALTNSKFTRVVMDNMAQEGWHVRKCYLLDLTACAAQGCGSTVLPGMRFGPEAAGVRMIGGDVHENIKDGIWIENGARNVEVLGVHVANNNTSNTAFGVGISVLADASRWRVEDCVIGNGIYDGIGVNPGHQKYGILVAGGNSTDFGVRDNTFIGNESAPMLLAQNAGANQVVTGNVPEVIASVAAAAALTLPYGEIITVTGSTGITSIAAGWVGRRVTLIFTGTPTVTDGSNLKLAGNLVATADDTLSLVCDGTNWIETGRSVN